MAEEKSKTPPNEPVGTEGDEPKATPPNEPQGAATDDDDEEMVTIKKSSLKKLQSEGTKSFERARQTEYQVAMIMLEKDANKFLDTNKEKFPDVKAEDLFDAEDEEDFEKLAGQTQARIDEAAQRRLGDLQKSTTPTLSPQEKAAQLKKLKENPGSSSFQKMLELESTK